ncbi:hypothetical protein J5N97_025994 [Dioscorea zingiberensis]|uniref:Uncharacterized protein n=1 Tax=Dioscorea zingiberensis TaxID=325984 RepID=A0A9D5C1K4_9LILI|nr:hypothetical protein J5N97_025994 [Dioscorea zingiberensis]
MISRSHTNLVALGTGNFEGMDAGGGGSGVSGGDDEGERKRQRRRTLGMDITEIDDDEDGMSSDAQERIIIVANQLPLQAIRDTADSGWVFSWDEESLLLHLKEGLPVGKEVIYVGSLPVRVNPADEDVVSQSLLDRFNCVPAFLPVDLKRLFYHQFCKKYLWPLFHYAIPLTAHHGGFFDRSHWEAYVRANKIFSDKVLEVLTSDRDFVWIHDYHLMVLPKFLRHRFYRLRIGFFFHSPFPSSEIFRTLPVREELIKGLLNCDLIGFHTYDYARHFLSVCLRLMGLEHHLRRGYIGLDYHGRTIGIKISPVGINLQQFKDVIGSPEMQSTLAKLKEKFAGKVVLLGVDDLDPFKGINLKLLAFKKMLEMNSSMKGNPVLVQIVKPARSEGKEIEETQKEILEIYKRINSVFGTVFYRPVVYIDSPVSLAERIAYYTLADCLVVTSVRDGMNLTPYEYLVCRQEASGYDSGCPKTSMLVVSEFVGCSLSLSGAIRTNPWNVISTGEAMQRALEATETEKQMWHDKHYKYVCEHDVGYWSRGFFQDLQRSCEDHFNKRFLSLGVGFGFRVMALDPEFTKLKPPEVLVDYSNAERRAIFLDYDGTLMPQKHIHEQPSEEIISMLNSLTASDRNVVYIVLC